MRKAVITGSGAYVPEKIVPNSFFNEVLQEDVDTWLRENVHIYNRRWCGENESVVDLCLSAAKNAIEDAAITADDIQLIIVATDTPEYISPSTASKLQHLLQANHTGAFDINTACAGFVTALDMASKYIIADKQYKNILVIGAYAMSKYLNIEDKKTATLFADGAGAVILSAQHDTDSGYIAGDLMTQGQYCDWMGIYAGGTFKPLSQEVLDKKEHLLQFVKKFPKELNPTMWTSMIQKLCKENKVEVNEVKGFFITQININSIWETMDRLGVDRKLAPTVMHEFGYTGSAAIPIAFHIARKSGKVKQGDYVVFVGSGGGLSFASVLLKL
ncbi:MAG TPA: ketoacyl-ACP synthase III [Chitinophagales bacterium]|nr:ketoacyl-ACP synthase III [Chitinophagales bacterium]HNL84441.1 ketoacyl-ACP synthase III [Chitinophagales bacterium]